jgi:hypothetical protein
MKTANLKTFFNKSVKSQLISNDWEIKGHVIYLPIKSGLLKGVYINSSSFSKNQFEAVGFIQPLFVPSEEINFTFSEILRSRNKRQWWEYDETQLEQLGQEFANEINKMYSSLFSKVDNALTFYEYYKNDRKKTVRHFEGIAYACAYAQLPNAKLELEQLTSFTKKKEDMKLDWVKSIFENTEMLLAAGDPISVLKDWEIRTREDIKM